MSCSSKATKVSSELTWRNDIFTPNQLQAQIWNQIDPANAIGFWWTVGRNASGSY